VSTGPKSKQAAPSHDKAPVGSQSIEDARKSLNEIVDGLSQKSEKVVFGLLAFVWLFIAGSSSAPQIRVAASNAPLFGIGALCILSLVCSFLQSVFAYWVVHETHDLAEKAERQWVSYSRKDWRRTVQEWMFKLKLIFAAVAAVWFCVLLIHAAV